MQMHWSNSLCFQRKLSGHTALNIINLFHSSRMKLQKQQFIGQALDTDIAHTDCRTCLLTKRHHSARTEGDNNPLVNFYVPGFWCNSTEERIAAQSSFLCCVSPYFLTLNGGILVVRYLDNNEFPVPLVYNFKLGRKSLPFVTVPQQCVITSCIKSQ